MDENPNRTGRLNAKLRQCHEAMPECEDRVEVATRDAKVQLLSDLADALRERHVFIQQKIDAIRLHMGLPVKTHSADGSDGLPLLQRRLFKLQFQDF